MPVAVLCAGTAIRQIQYAGAAGRGRERGGSPGAALGLSWVLLVRDIGRSSPEARGGPLGLEVFYGLEL